MCWTGCTQTDQPHKVFPGWTSAIADIAVQVPASVWTSQPCNQPTGPPLRVSNLRELESCSSMPTSGMRGESMKMVSNVTEAPVDQNANCVRSMAADLYILHICYCPKKVNFNQTLTGSWKSLGHCWHVPSTSARHPVQPGEYFPGLHQLPLIVSHLQMNWTKGIEDILPFFEQWSIALLMEQWLPTGQPCGLKESEQLYQLFTPALTLKKSDASLTILSHVI